MGGGGNSKGGPTNQQAEQSQGQLAQTLSGLLTQQEGQSNQLFNLAFPGMQQATGFYESLASGDPAKIAQVIAPAAQQISQQTAGAKQNILQTAPAGGERNLAIEQADVSQGAQLGALSSQGYTGAFNALAQMGGQGAGLSQGAASTAIGAGQAAGSQYSNLIQEHIQQKGASLGAFGGLAGDASQLGAAAIGALA